MTAKLSIPVYVSKEEKEGIEKRAKEAGMSVSAYLKSLALKKRSFFDIIKEGNIKKNFKPQKEKELKKLKRITNGVAKIKEHLSKGYKAIESKYNDMELLDKLFKGVVNDIRYKRKKGFTDLKLRFIKDELMDIYKEVFSSEIKK